MDGAGILERTLLGGNGLGSKLLEKLTFKLLKELLESDEEQELLELIDDELTNRGRLEDALKAAAAELLVLRLANRRA
jgi:hypothetical protein